MTDHLRKGKEVPFYASLTAGSVAGLSARMVTAPLDTIKIRLQLQMNEGKYQGLVRSMATIVKEEGVFALWKGNVPACALYIIYGGVQFSSYAVCNTALASAGLPSSVHYLAVGSLAGISSSLVTYPLDLMRTRFAANRHDRLPFFASAVKIYHNEGFFGFFKGLNSAMTAISLNTAITFWSYEAIKIFSEQSAPWLSPFAGSVAGVISKFVTFPLDTIRKRLQVKNAKELKRYGPHSHHLVGYSDSFVKCGWEIAAREGVRNLYRGYLVAMIKAAPVTGITMWMYEVTLRLMV